MEILTYSETSGMAIIQSTDENVLDLTSLSQGDFFSWVFFFEYFN